jgi:protein-tyrosine-phosphatase
MGACTCGVASDDINDPRLSVLFLCTGNSARSQLAEALLRNLSHGRIDVFSAGTAPQADVHPLTRQVLAERYGIDASALIPKSLEQFLSRRFDVVVTVCDEAAEVCPVFPHAAQQVHWNFEDPVAVPAGPDQKRAFENVASGLVGRLRIWMSLPAVARRMTAG